MSSTPKPSVAFKFRDYPTVYEQGQGDAKYVSKADARDSNRIGSIRYVFLDQTVGAAVIRRVVSNYTSPVSAKSCVRKTCLIKPTGVLFGLQATPLVRKSRALIVLIERFFDEEIYAHKNARSSSNQ